MARLSGAMVLVLAMALGSPLFAQDATPQLTVAGFAKNPSAVGQNELTVRVRNAATGQTLVTTTPSLAGAQPGYFALEFLDLGGNRAAQVGDRLEFSVFNGPVQLSANPDSRVVTSGDAYSSVLRAGLTVDPAATPPDLTPPMAALSYSTDSSNVRPASLLTLSVGFSEPIATTSAVQFRVTGPTGVKTAHTATRVSATAYSVAYTVPATQGVYSVEVLGARDAAGNSSLPASNNTFRVSSVTLTGPSLALGNVSGEAGTQVAMPVTLVTAGWSIGGLQFRANFDASRLTFARAEAGPAAVESDCSVVANESSTGTVSVVVFGLTESPLGAGRIVDVVFTVNASQPAGTVIPVLGSGLEVHDLSAVAIPNPTISSGAVTVSRHVDTFFGCFDVDQDTDPGRSSDIVYLVNSMLERDGFRTCQGTGGTDCFDVRQDGVPGQAADLQFLIDHSLALAVASTCGSHDNVPAAGSGASIGFQSGRTVLVGSETTVELSLTNTGTPGVSCLVASLEASAHATCVGIVPSALLSGKSLDTQLSPQGKLSLVISGGTGVLGSGVLATLRYRGLSPGTATLSVTRLDAANASAVPLSGVTAADGSLTVNVGATAPTITGLSYSATTVTGTTPLPVRLTVTFSEAVKTSPAPTASLVRTAGTGTAPSAVALSLVGGGASGTLFTGAFTPTFANNGAYTLVFSATDLNDDLPLVVQPTSNNQVTINLPVPACPNVPLGTIVLQQSTLRAPATLNGNVTFSNLCPSGTLLAGATVDLVGSGLAARNGVGLTPAGGSLYAFSAAIAADAGVEGTYTLRFNARDSESGQNATAAGNTSFTVLPANRAPQVTAGASSSQVFVGNAVSLTAEASDADGDPLTYAWTQTGGTHVDLTAPGDARTSVTMTAAGTYTFRVVAGDGRGGGRTKTR